MMGIDNPPGFLLIVDGKTVDIVYFRKNIELRNKRCLSGLFIDTANPRWKNNLKKRYSSKRIK